MSWFVCTLANELSRTIDVYINTLLHTFPCYHEETFKALIFIVFIHLVRSISPILSNTEEYVFLLHAEYLYPTDISTLLHVFLFTNLPQFRLLLQILFYIIIQLLAWPCGPMVASDYESGDFRFESYQSRFCSQVHVSTLFFIYKRIWSIISV